MVVVTVAVIVESRLLDLLYVVANLAIVAVMTVMAIKAVCILLSRFCQADFCCGVAVIAVVTVVAVVAIITVVAVIAVVDVAVKAVVIVMAIKTVRILLSRLHQDDFIMR